MRELIRNFADAYFNRTDVIEFILYDDYLSHGLMVMMIKNSYLLVCKWTN